MSGDFRPCKPKERDDHPRKAMIGERSESDPTEEDDTADCEMDQAILTEDAPPGRKANLDATT